MYDSYFDKMMSPETHKKVSMIDVLLFDEISMCFGHFFDVLECMVAIIWCYKEACDRIKQIKENAPQIDENIGGASYSESLIMASYMLEQQWEDLSMGGLGNLPPWCGMNCDWRLFPIATRP